MAGAKKAKHAGEKAKGKVKEVTGKVTGSKRLQLEGKAEQGKAAAKQRGEKLKRAVRKAAK